MFSLTGFLLAFASGVFGAAIGAQTAFIFVGFLVIAGVAINVATGNGDFTSTVAFGAWGPHVGGFAAGVAATAFAAKRNKLGEGESGRSVNLAMMGANSFDVLLIGGIFGVLGYVLNILLAMPGGWTDTVALTVFLSGMLSRVLFSSTGLLGKVPAGESRFSPSSSYCWVPWQSSLLQVLVIGLGAGLFGSYLAVSVPNGGMVLGFGISAASLVFIQFGTKVPVTHHITLPAAVATVASGGSILWGAIFGIGGALIGELYARLFNIWGDTHIDPPAGAIATMTSISILFATVGIYSAIPLVF
ncbi:MAG: permease [Spirochaetes bacterium]|nr:permease [Spirochaetota bacterium]